MTESICPETHNPGGWPYVARCVRTEGHAGDHVDRKGGSWPNQAKRIDPQQALYIDAVKNAMLGVVLPWLTTVCPECGLDLLEYEEETQGDHVMLGQFVIVGCEGYLIVNPNVVGIFRINWHDWRGDANELPQT